MEMRGRRRSFRPVRLAPRSIKDVAVSPLAFGSMRLDERPLDDAAWIRLLSLSHDLGLTTLHSSTEYATFYRFCRLVEKLARPMQHIVKLAEPHFGDTAFDRKRLDAKINHYLKALGAERLDVVQWMWRGDLKDERGRLYGFACQRDELRDAFDALRRSGKVGAVAGFPYTPQFADAVIDAGLCEGLAVYLNPVEREMVPQIERAAAVGMASVAIRPLAAGKALEAMSPAACVGSVLAQRGIATAVVTYSSSEHLRELL
jgi:predicted aldo/keto reductase-like oxidoreductase